MLMKIPQNTRIYCFSLHNETELLYSIDRENYLEFVALQ
jgi:hypothetical protein